MMSQKSHSLKLFLWKNFFTLTAAFFAAFLSINFYSNEASALFVPTLSASVDQTNLQINGNQVINSTNKTTEIPLNLTVNTNNKTGYTATLSSETENTALTNADSTAGAKIDSISTNLSLNNLPNNTWGYKFGASTNYAPIPALSSPAQILQTAGKTNGNEMNSIKIGMKLTDNLESGNYTNKLILSFVSNPYQMHAIMTEGPDFNTKLKSLETAANKIEHFKKSSTPPATTANAKNIEDEDSDYEIKLWLDPADKTAYYYAEPEKVYLNEDSSKMFYYLPSLISLELSSFDTSNVTNMNHMFYIMSSLTSLNLSNFDTSQVTDMRSMFSGMVSLTTLDLSNFDTSQVTDMSSMFRGISSLATLDLSNFNTSRVTDMEEMFYGMSSLISLDLSSFDTSQVTNMSWMFRNMYNLTSLNLSSFNTSNVTNMRCMFADIYNLTSLNLTNFDTSNVTDMGAMFANMHNLTSLNLSSFNTSKVTIMGSMFSQMYNLTTLNLSNFDTSKVTSMSNMFFDTHNLTSLNLSNFDTSQVTDMRSMFSHMFNLTSLNLSNFNTSRVTDMEEMFYGTNLTTLDLSNFNTTKVTNMSSMFDGMISLTTLDLSNFDTSRVTKMDWMFSLSNRFASYDKLEKIYVNNDFDTYSLARVSDMFENRKKLRGGNGSYLADPSAADKTWLRVDRPGVHGYFTRKP